jgi:hypothetical protein
MRAVSLVLGVLIVVSVSPGFAVSPDEETAIRETALNYIEGWYEGNADRMDEALHPDLAKRLVYTHPKTGGSLLNGATKSLMLEYTRGGGGSDTPEDQIKNEVTILDTHGNMASVKIVSIDFVDYLHIVKWNGEWKILNVLWESLPKESR